MHFYNIEPRKFPAIYNRKLSKFDVIEAVWEYPIFILEYRIFIIIWPGYLDMYYSYLETIVC